MNESPHSALYFGKVMHERVRPFNHRFNYSVFSLFLDLDEIEDLSRSTRIFSYNTFNVFSFYNADHGDKSGADLKPWVLKLLEKAGISDPITSVRLLCYPRILGYVFNPLSVYYCYGEDEKLVALVYEVSNTFGEEHSYVGHVGQMRKMFSVQTTQKIFYVSPFIEVTGQYSFKFDKPQKLLRLAIEQSESGEPTLLTSFSARRRAFCSQNLLKAFFSYPLMTLKVILAIHWQALKLCLKGAVYVPRPERPDTSFSKAHSASSRVTSDVEELKQAS